MGHHVSRHVSFLQHPGPPARAEAAHVQVRQEPTAVEIRVHAETEARAEGHLQGAVRPERCGLVLSRQKEARCSQHCALCVVWKK